MSCGDCKNMIYKSDCRTDRFTAGIEDFCGAGCLLVKGIRVPFPDCTVHAMRSFKSESVVYLEV